MMQDNTYLTLTQKKNQAKMPDIFLKKD